MYEQGDTVTCPEGQGVVFLMIMGYAYVRLSDGTEWVGAQKECVKHRGEAPQGITADEME